MASITIFETRPVPPGGAASRSRTLAKLLLLSSFWQLPLVTAASAGTDIVVSTGVSSPDGNGVLSLFRAPSINSNGQLAFVGQLSGTSGGTADDEALFRLSSGTLAHIAREGQAINGKSVIWLFSPYIDNAGTVGGVAALGSPTTSTHFFGTGQPLTFMYTPGNPSPSGNNTLSLVTSAAVNDAGGSAYLALYTGSKC